MDSVINLLKNFQIYFILGLTIAVILLLIIVMVQMRSIGSLEKRYRKLTRGVNNKNLEELIISYLDRIDEVKDDSIKLKEAYDGLSTKVKGCIQKVAITRYRAFEDVGSDLSFSIALLDENNSGTILTGIYGRHESNTYAKPVDKGISRYDLSEEELEVLQTAMNSK